MFPFLSSATLVPNRQSGPFLRLPELTAETGFGREVQIFPVVSLSNLFKTVASCVSFHYFVNFISHQIFYIPTVYTCNANYLLQNPIISETSLLLHTLIFTMIPKVLKCVVGLSFSCDCWITPLFFYYFRQEVSSVLNIALLSFGKAHVHCSDQTFTGWGSEYTLTK